MNGIEPLLGARVDAVAFGVAHFQLQLSRDDAAAFSLSTSADVSCDPAGGEATDFRDSKDATGLIDLVGAELIDLVVHGPGRDASVRFDDGREVRAWWPDAPNDNLFIVRRDGSEDWWTIE